MFIEIKNLGKLKTIKLLSIRASVFLRSKLLQCRISSIEERIEKLQDLSLFFQTRFDNDKSDKINNKIEYLSQRRMELLAVFQ
jgi:hypothetical protein